jgi:hypothetical protein
MDTATELEQWLRKEASERIQRAESRRTYARSGRDCTDEDKAIAHILAEQMLGRKLPKTSRTEEEKNARIEERIASRLDKEAAMILRFANFVCSIREAPISDGQ